MFTPHVDLAIAITTTITTVTVTHTVATRCHPASSRAAAVVGSTECRVGVRGTGGVRAGMGMETGMWLGLGPGTVATTARVIMRATIGKGRRMRRRSRGEHACRTGWLESGACLFGWLENCRSHGVVRVEDWSFDGLCVDMEESLDLLGC